MTDLLPLPEGVQYKAEVGSTMDEIRALARAGAPEWTVVLADQQTHGRGRRGKVWQSQAGSGLYFSILLRPRVTLSSLGLLPLLVGASLAASIQSHLGLTTQLKWSNDLLSLDGRKLAGILLESEVIRNNVKFVVLGIGVNVHRQDFPEELRATALEEFGEVKRGSLFRAVFGRLRLDYARFLEQPEFALQLWKSFPNSLGKIVQILEPSGDTWSGIALDLDSSGALLVQTETEIKTVFAGEVSLLR